MADKVWTQNLKAVSTSLSDSAHLTEAVTRLKRQEDTALYSVRDSVVSTETILQILTELREAINGELQQADTITVQIEDTNSWSEYSEYFTQQETLRATVGRLTYYDAR